MVKLKNEKLVKETTPSEQNVQEIAKEVIAKCKSALGSKSPIKSNKTKGKTCSPKLSWDKVSEDIKNILNQLSKECPKMNKYPMKPVELRIQEKEFFKVETGKKKKNIKKETSDQSPGTPSTKQSKLFKNTDSARGVRSDCSSKCGSLNTIRSCTIFKKVPITRSELQTFKKKIELSALESIKSPELIKLIDKEKVAKNVSILMKEALALNEDPHKLPVIDVGNFIRQSLKMSSISEDLADVKRIANAKIKIAPSDTELKLEKTEEIYNMKNREKVGKNEQNSFPDEKNNLTKPCDFNMLVKSIKSSTDAFSETTAVREESRTSENPVPKQQKSQVQKNSQKNALASLETSPSSRKLIAEKGIKQNKVRSNSTLRNSNISTNSKPAPLQKLRNIQNNSERTFMSAPVCSFSSASSRLLNRTRPNSSGAAPNTHFNRVPRSNLGQRRIFNPVQQLKEEVNRAIRDRKTFTVSGQFPAVRKALLRRGWIEKYNVNIRDRLHNDINSLRNRSINQLVDLLQVKDLNEICKKLIRSKLLGNHQVDLYWGHNYEPFKLTNDKIKLTKINKFRRDVFSYTSKQGLCEAVKTAHWFNFPGLARINHPRTYTLAENGETKEFIKDFRHTAAMSLLKWIVRSHETKECKIISNSGRVPLEAFQFACNECYKMLIEANNQDIDQPIKQAHDHEWSQFLEYFYKILHTGNHLKAGNAETEETIVEKSQYLLNKLEPHYPHNRMDGTMNIWILKPAVGSQGKGIHICRTMQYVMNTVRANINTRYIAQKYIERPLLIFNTKFDIRQWFLISSAHPLTIWMYKECYLRFSSQTYNLRKLHESVHLTNNSVQKHYQNVSHDITLPHYNMWDSIQFRNYLSNIGYPDIYGSVIYKGMKECIIGAVMIHQDKIDKRKNCFELYGADFMLTEDFQPWLIEINSSPALFASTPITSRMCPQVLEDTIKVVVDRAASPKAKTGNFELIYSQPRVHCNKDSINDLKVSGKHLPKSYFCLEEDKNAKRIAPMSITENLRMEKNLSKSKSEILAENVKETLENLLQFIQSEKKRRVTKKLIAKGTDPILPEQGSIEEKNGSLTNTNLSFASLRSNLNLLASSNKISFTKEDENMLDQALKMLKSKRETEVVKYLLEILERIAWRAS